MHTLRKAKFAQCACPTDTVEGLSGADLFHAAVTRVLFMFGLVYWSHSFIMELEYIALCIVAYTLVLALRNRRIRAWKAQNSQLAPKLD